MSLSTVYETLGRFDFTYQTTRPVNPKRDETAVAQWKADFPAHLKELLEQHPDKHIKVFFQDEARFGQKGIKSKQWADKGERPSRPCQDEHENGYIFGAVEPESGQHHVLVATDVCKEFMQHFVNSFSRTLGRGARHAGARQCRLAHNVTVGGTIEHDASFFAILRTKLKSSGELVGLHKGQHSMQLRHERR